MTSLPRVDINKALNSSNSGSILMQPEIDKIIAQLVEYKNPLRQNLDRKPGSGDAWYINRRTAPGTTPAAFVNDTEDLVEDNGSYGQTKFEYKTIAARGKVTRKLRATGRSYVDVLAEEIEARSQDYKDYEDYAMVVGCTVNTAGIPTGGSKQFDGIRFLIPATQQVVCGGTGHADLTLAKMDEAIDKSTGDPDMLIMSKTGRRKLNGLLQIYQRFVDKMEVKGGFIVMAYNNTPIYRSTNVSNAQICDTSAGVTTASNSETGGSSTSIYVLDSEHTWMGVLTEITMEPLAKTSSQFDLFDIYCDEVLVVRNNQRNSKLVGVAV